MPLDPNSLLYKYSTKDSSGNIIGFTIPDPTSDSFIPVHALENEVAKMLGGSGTISAFGGGEDDSASALAKMIVFSLDTKNAGRTDQLRSMLDQTNAKLEAEGKPSLGSFEDVNKNFGGFQNLGGYLVNGGSLGTTQNAKGVAIAAPQGPVGQNPMNESAGAGGKGQKGPTGTISADNSGSGSSSPQIYRDNANNFFSVDAQGNKTPLDINQFHALGLNETFVKPGQTVSLSQAQTGQVGAPGTSGSYGATGGAPGASGVISGLPSWADQKAIDGLKFTFGWTDDQAKQFIQSNPSDAQMWALTGEYQKNQVDLGQAKLATNAQAWNDAFTAATKELADPSSALGAKYNDIKQTDLTNFQQNLATLQTGADIQSQQQQIEFQNQQKAAADAAAAAGQAYSGYREQAKQQLGTTQSGIVRSSLSDLEQSLKSQLQPLEQFYGSSQFSSLFPNAGVNYLNPLTGQSQQVAYKPVGNLTGSEKAQQQSDIQARQSQIFQGTQSPT